MLTEYQQLQVDQALKNGLSSTKLEAVLTTMQRKRSRRFYGENTAFKSWGGYMLMPNIEGQEIEYADAVKIIFSSKSESEAAQKFLRNSRDNQRC